MMDDYQDPWTDPTLNQSTPAQPPQAGAPTPDPWSAGTGAPAAPTPPAAGTAGFGDATTPGAAAPATTTPATAATAGAGTGDPAQAQTSRYQDLMSKIASAPNPSDAAIAHDELSRNIYDDLIKAGHDVNWKDDQLLVDGRPYTVGAYSAKHEYTPGAIGTDDIPQLTLDQWAAKGSAQTPVEDLADQVMTDVLKDPFGGLNDEYVGNLKAKAKDEAADSYTQNERAIGDSAHMLGQDETLSPWAQSQILSARRDRDMGLAGINRDIDINVTDKRAANQRATAQLGASFAGQKAAQRQAVLALASDSVFKQAAAIGDRLALRESVAQKAAELGIQQDQLMSQYILGQQGELTKRLGLAANYDIDRKKLEQSSSDFKLELMSKIAELQERERQHDDDYGLELEKQGHTEDEDAFNRANPRDTTYA